MSTPATYSNPEKEAQDLDDKTAEAYEQGHDADIPSKRAHAASNLDVEKGVQSAAVSTNSDRTLGGDPSAEAEAEAEQDPDIVDWDGPDDPENPMNWPPRKKWTLIFILAMVTLVTYVLPKTFEFPSLTPIGPSHPRSSPLVSLKS